jgi:hypothetical protein
MIDFCPRFIPGPPEYVAQQESAAEALCKNCKMSVIIGNVWSMSMTMKVNSLTVVCVIILCEFQNFSHVNIQIISRIS